MILCQGWCDSPAKCCRLHQALFITFKDQVEKSIQLYINNLYIYIFISLYSILCLNVPIQLLYYTKLSFFELLKSIMYPLLENIKVIHNTLLLSTVFSLANVNINLWKPFSSWQHDLLRINKIDLSICLNFFPLNSHYVFLKWYTVIAKNWKPFQFSLMTRKKVIWIEML